MLARLSNNHTPSSGGGMARRRAPTLRHAHGVSLSVRLFACTQTARGGLATTRDLVRFAFCSTCHEENLAFLNFCWKYVTQSARVLPAPRYPRRSPVVEDAQKLRARRQTVLAAMEGGPGKVRKNRVADEFDAFVLVISAGSRGWTTATPDDVFEFICYLDTQGKGTKLVHATSCPGVSRAGDDACLAGFSCARRYAAESI